MTSDRVSNERLAEMLAGLEGVTPGPWKSECKPNFENGYTYTSVQPDTPDPDKLRHLAMANGEFHVCRMTHTPLERKFRLYARDAAHIARCDPDTMRSILTELQHLRSPVTVSDEMVERAMSSIEGEPDLYITKGAMRWAITAALVPAEQEGEKPASLIESLSDEEWDRDKSGDNPNAGSLAPTPGGDNRVVAWRVRREGMTSWIHIGDDPSFGSDGAWEVDPLVPLSVLTKLTAEKDQAIAANYRQAGCIQQCAAHLGPDTSGTIAGLPLAVKAVVARAETAEASLAAAREALEPFAAEKLPGNNRDLIDYDRHGLRRSMSPMEIARRNAFFTLHPDQHPLAKAQARAALAGSNGE